MRAQASGVCAAPEAAAILAEHRLPGESLFPADASSQRVYRIFHTDRTAAYFEKYIVEHAQEFAVDGLFVIAGEPVVQPGNAASGQVLSAVALDLTARRLLHQSLYTLFHGSLRERGQVIVQAPQPWPMLHAFADLLIVGDNHYQSVASRRLTTRPLQERFPPDAIPYLYGSVLHRVPTLWHYVAPNQHYAGAIRAVSRQELVTDEELFALGVLMDLPPWSLAAAPAPLIAQLERLAQLHQTLGFTAARWYPYWEEHTLFQAQPATVPASAWRREDGALLIALVNLTGKEQDALITLGSTLASPAERWHIAEVWASLPVRARDTVAALTLAPGQLGLLYIAGR